MYTQNNDTFIRKARGTNISRQAQRVYLCFNQANINKINILIDDLLSQDAGMDCVVSYIDNIEKYDENDILNELKETRVIIVWVTKEFLNSINKSGIPIDFTIANEQNIPILPIAQDEGLLPIFTDRISKLHGIAMNDPEYRVKLKSQLENFLASDSLKQQINSKAFTAEIFLSYRKLDLDDAREFMKDLHNVDGLQGISIWYDQFLTAGREFDIEIQEAIEKSTVFVLLVTPNITKNNNTGELNYVAREEVPFAIKKEKIVLPVEAKPCDSATFAVVFPAIGEPVSKSVINTVFREKLGDDAYITSLGSERAYLLGMAYLRGHRVERDIERAVKLLIAATKTSNKFALDAAEQLAKIYEDGLGSAHLIDYNNALDWWQKAGSLSERINGKNSHLTATIYNKTGTILKIIGEYKRALEFHNKAIRIFIKLYGKEHSEVGLTYSNIGKVYIKLGKSLGISVLYNALKIFQNNYGENHPYTAGAYLDIGINHIENDTFVTLHSIESAFYNLGGGKSINKGAEYALACFSKALVIYKNIYGDNHYYTAVANNYLGKVFIYLEQYNEAQEYLNSALKTMNDIYGEEHLYSAYVYANLGLLYKYLQDYDNALVNLNKVIEINKNHFNENNVVLSLMYNVLGEVYLHFSKYNEALEYFTKDAAILMDNYESDVENLRYEKKALRRSHIPNFIFKFMPKNKVLMILFFVLLLPVLIIIGTPLLIKFLSKLNKILFELNKKTKGSSSDKPDFDEFGAVVYSSLNFRDRNSAGKLLIKIKEKHMYIADLYYKISDFENAFKYYKLSIEIKKRTGMMEVPDEENFLIFLKTGTMCFLTNRLNEANRYCIKALKIHNEFVKMKIAHDKNKKKKKTGQDDDKREDTVDFNIYNINVVKLYDTLGQIHNLQKNYKESLEHFTKAIEIYNLFPSKDDASTEGDINIRDYHDISLIYSKIGKIYKELSEPDKALLNYNKALESLLYDTGEDDSMIDEIIGEIIELLNNDTDGKLSHMDTILFYYGVNVISVKINSRFNKFFEIKITTIDDNDEDLAKLHFFTGNVYTKLGEKTEAIEHFEKALILYNKLIENCIKESDNEKHLKLLKEKLKVETSIFGGSSIETAKTCYSIGFVYKSLGDINKRLEYYKKGLEIRIKTQGEEHSDTATQYNNVAVAYNSIGEREKAIENHNKAISIRLKLLGEEHNDTASSYTNIAYVYRDMDEHQKALDYFEKALKIYKKSASKNNKKQIELYNEIIKLQEHLFGENHEKVATSFTDLGGQYMTSRDFTSALENAKKGLEIRKNIFGDNNNVTATSYFNVGMVYYRLKDYQKSLEYHKTALDLRKKLNTDVDYNISMSLYYIGLIYKELNDVDKALEYCEEALEINKRLFSENDERIKYVSETIERLNKDMSAKEVSDPSN